MLTLPPKLRNLSVLREGDISTCLSMKLRVDGRTDISAFTDIWGGFDQ